jgi:hypothetical protein
MTKLILERWGNRYSEIQVVFANTGQEHEETLRFVDRCDRELGFNVVWVEAVVHLGARKAPTHKIVTYDTANRTGRLFEEMIQKYGIPNKAFPHCTRSLKLMPIQSYARSIGWKPGSYDTAIGIRNDEVDRLARDAASRRLVYPLASDWPVKKPGVNAFWKAQPFRLNLHAWQGNCTWCWKKSLRKHITNLQTEPASYDFPERMEAKYPRVGPEFKKDPSAPDRVFFRSSMNTAALRELARKAPYDPPSDSNDFDPVLDVGGGCGESCEIYADDMEIFR